MYVVLSSFLPKGGQILSVAVYPSEFGLQRMKEEELHGPIALFDDEEEKNDEDDDEDFDPEKLRAYEMSRLRSFILMLLFIFVLKITRSSFEFTLLLTMLESIFYLRHTVCSALRRLL